MILGYDTGLPATGFDAPGVLQILSDQKLLAALKPLGKVQFNNVGDTVDVRIRVMRFRRLENFTTDPYSPNPCRMCCSHLMACGQAF